MRIAAFACCALLLFAGFAFAQSKNTGELSGTVSDPSSAVVPKAKVTVTNAETGITRETLTDERGEYRMFSPDRAAKQAAGARRWKARPLSRRPLDAALA